MDEAFRHTFGFLTRDIGRLLARRFAEKERARGIGASLAQSRTMAYLVVHPGINQACLADLLEVQPISLARLLDRMEAAQWVERRPDPADRRAKRVYLTDKAHTFFEKLWDIAQENNAEALAGLSPEQAQLLHQMLERVHDNLLRLNKVAALTEAE